MIDCVTSLDHILDVFRHAAQKVQLAGVSQTLALSAMIHMEYVQDFGLCRLLDHYSSMVQYQLWDCLLC